jgi:uncharacterized protein YdeI (YjbR/CyaY-like superfamily)
VFYKAHTGVKSIPYEDMVREALCFGWIDSLVKRLDDDRFALKVTPRQPTSKWSDINRKRWVELKAAGLLTSAGLAAAPTNNTYAPRPIIPDLPVYIAKALKANSKAWEFFRELAPTYRRDFVVWIHTAKRAETRERRIREYRYETIRPGNYPRFPPVPAHVHYVVRAPGYKPIMFELWFEDDPALAERRKVGMPDVPTIYPPHAVAIRPVTRDAAGVWHSTRDLTMVRE